MAADKHNLWNSTQNGYEDSYKIFYLIFQNHLGKLVLIRGDKVVFMKKYGKFTINLSYP